MEEIYRTSLEFHERHEGKLEVKSKVQVGDKKTLSLVYTPGVAAVSSEIAKNKNLAKKYTIKGNSVAVISDGSAVLGLGNIGPEAAIPVMEGKAVLFKELADIDAFPVCLASQEAEEIISTVKNIAPVFGAINLEDISAPRCFEIEARLQNELDIPVMHDDQHGSAVVVLAGLINAVKLKGLSREKATVVISGAGAAGSAVARLLVRYGFGDVVVCDSNGVIYEGRVGLDGEKAALSRITNRGKLKGDLKEAIREKDIFVGVSRGGIVDEEMILSIFIIHIGRDKRLLFLLREVPPKAIPY